MSATPQHRLLNPVRACLLLIVVHIIARPALIAQEKLPARSEWSDLFPTLFAEEKPRAQSELSHSFSPVEDIRVRTQRTQRTQRTGDDRVRDFYDSARTQQVQQQRAEDRKYLQTHPRFSSSSSYSSHAYRR